MQKKRVALFVLPSFFLWYAEQSKAESNWNRAQQQSSNQNKDDRRGGDNKTRKKHIEEKLTKPKQSTCGGRGEEKEDKERAPLEESKVN